MKTWTFGLSVLVICGTVQAQDDDTDGVHQSLVYYAALAKAHVPAEMHLFAHGGHAFGLRQTGLPIAGWPSQAEAWLRTLGILPNQPVVEKNSTRLSQSAIVPPMHTPP